MEAEKQKGPGLKKKVEKSKNPKYTKRTEIFTEGNCVRYIQGEREEIVIDTDIYPEYMNYSYKLII